LTGVAPESVRIASRTYAIAEAQRSKRQAPALRDTCGGPIRLERETESPT